MLGGSEPCEVAGCVAVNFDAVLLSELDSFFDSVATSGADLLFDRVERELSACRERWPQKITPARDRLFDTVAHL